MINSENHDCTALFSIVPVGTSDIHVSKYMAPIDKILLTSGITYQLHAEGTSVQGKWTEIFKVICACNQQMQLMDVPRTIVHITLDSCAAESLSLKKKQQVADNTIAQVKHGDIEQTEQKKGDVAAEH